MSIEKIAFVFPGQGSQSLNMLASFVEHEPIIQEVFAQVSSFLGYDAWQLCQKGPAETLNKTIYTH